jgi:hypothetical protein
MTNPTRFSRGLYAKTHLAAASLVDHLALFVVRQFAAGDWHFAREIAAKHPEVELLDWSDYDPELARMAVESGELPGCVRVSVLDATDPALWSAVSDLVVCGSLEHLPNDRDLIAAIQPGTRVLLWGPDFDAPDHLRHYDSMNDLIARYGDLLSVTDKVTVEWPREGKRTLRKFVLLGRRS